MTTIDSNGNITATKGDTLVLTFTDVKENGSTITFAGWSAKFQIREYATASSTLLSLTSSSGITLTSGQIVITATASQMNITPGNYVYDLEMTRASGAVETWFNGKQFQILGDVAR